MDNEQHPTDIVMVLYHFLHQIVKHFDKDPRRPLLPENFVNSQEKKVHILHPNELEEYSTNHKHHVKNDTDNDEDRYARIAVQGCSHGDLNSIYKSIENYQTKTNHKIDALLCCGDFQSLRNTSDYTSLAVPAKYRSIGSFHEYYACEKIAPVLTIFIGGNHENMKALQELYYGGWVAPNIYYLGCAGVIYLNLGSRRNGRLRIAGLSGIFKGYDYNKGHFEFPPYSNDTLRSVFHVRNIDVYRLQCLSNSNYSSPSIKESSSSDDDKLKSQQRLNIMMTHDWPRGIEQHGDTQALLRKKKFFAQEVYENRLGSPVSEELLYLLRPKQWFSGHLHVKFEATVRHSKPSQSKHDLFPNNEDQNCKQIDNVAETNHDMKNHNNNAHLNEEETDFIALESESCIPNVMDLTAQMTQFLALDKCLPKRKHLQIITIPCDSLNETHVSSSDSKSPDKTLNTNERFTNTDECIANTTTQELQMSHSNERDQEESKKEQVFIEYDLEWLAILRKTHNMSTTSRQRTTLPSFPMSISSKEIESVRSLLKSYFHRDKENLSADDHTDGAINPNDNDDGNEKITNHYDDDDVTKQSYYIRIPNNFVKTVPSFNEENHVSPQDKAKWWNGGYMIGNPQTDQFLEMLQLDHIVTVPYKFKHKISGEDYTLLSTQKIEDDNEIDLEEDTDLEPATTSNYGNEMGDKDIDEIIIDNNEIYLEGQQNSINSIPQNTVMHIRHDVSQLNNKKQESMDPSLDDNEINLDE